MSKGNFGVLPDGGKDPANHAVFDPVFDVFQQLNREILDQNKISGAALQSQSTEHWIVAHTGHRNPLKLYERALPDGNIAWTEGDTELLSYVDRYCYRCHNAVLYNVFDKAQVISFRRAMIRNLQLDWVPGNFQRVMPQDRHLDPATISKIVDYLSKVK